MSRPIAPPEISPARVGITDIGSKEFDIAPCGLVAEFGDQRRDDMLGALISGELGVLDRGPVIECLIVP
jgi:hypothetical protein